MITMQVSHICLFGVSEKKARTSYEPKIISKI